jgi:hypothetical protein
MKITAVLAISILVLSCNSENYKVKYRKAFSVPVKGNSWVTNDIFKNDQMITEQGVVKWDDTANVIKTYFRVEQPGEIRIAVRAKVNSGRSKIGITFGAEKRKITLSNIEFDTIEIGAFNINSPGYQALTMKGLLKTDSTFAEVSDILIAGAAVAGKVYYVKEDFYFGRRGPSVHLRYDIPKEAGNAVWFYNEITVPEGNDVYGSYFMANGFADGYFGIQVNSPDERRILFSVWSPYKTDNPKDIPDDFRIRLLQKGDDVHAGEFGNEGAGGQSYKKFMWKTGITYGFLLKGEPSPNNSTDYTAWFYAPETGKWQLIASFRRPKASSYLKSLYSFLENFWTGTGYITRKGLYSNQWICNKEGKWFELTGVKFTADATARKESRLDYSGGIENGAFFLRNCGFFDDKTEINSVFSREKTGKQPAIDFKKLE